MKKKKQNFVCNDKIKFNDYELNDFDRQVCTFNIYCPKLN